MLKKYVIVSIRNLLKTKLFTFINLLGLALGIASSFLVFIYVYYHYSFDDKYKESSIYRVLTDTYTADNQFVREWAFTMHFLGPELEKNFSTIQESVRMFEFEQLLTYSNDDIFFDRTIIGADPNVLKFFNLNMLEGDIEKALVEPRTAVITKSFADFLFKNEDPVGKIIGLGYGFHEPWQYKITGVIEDLPVNTHLRVDIFTSAIGVNSDLGHFTMFDGGDANYHYPMFDTYIKLSENTDIGNLENQIDKFVVDNMGGRIIGKYGSRKIHLQYIKDIHLKKNIDPNYLGGMERRSLLRSDEIDIRTVRWISYGAIILLVFSIFNYINLTYINSINRFKEIALRKIFGASLFKLFTQFFVESLILTLFASLLSFLLLVIFIDPFYSFLEIPPSFSVMSDYNVYIFFIGFIFAVVLIKSILLFLILLSINIINVQKGNISENKTGIFIRKALMATQLIASFVLISGALLLSKQITFFLDKDLGFEKNNVVVIRKYSMASGLETVDLSYLQPFKDELKKSSLIENVCLSTITPGFFYNTGQQVWVDQDRFWANTVYLDHDYMDVYKLKLLSGRFYSDQYNNEFGNVIINRKLMNMLGFKHPDDAIGKTMYMDDVSSHYIVPGPQKIIGVLEDFYQEPLSNGIAPMKFHLFNSNRGYYSIRLKEGSDKKAARSYIKEVFNRFYPKDQLNYYFLDDFLALQYKSDQKVKKIMQIYTYASILVAYLGLLAFSIYLIKVKKKSIAIRKVLGSSSLSITGILLKEYLIVLLVSIFIALPLAIVVVIKIFETYAYRISIGWLEFTITAALLMAVVLGTIASQAVKATFEKPIKSLRYD